MDKVDILVQRNSLLSDATLVNQLAPDIRATLQDPSSPHWLDAVAEAGLQPSLTEKIFIHFERVFPDICARWLLSLGDLQRKSSVTSALARILCLAPYLTTFVNRPGHPTTNTSLSIPPLRLDLNLINSECLSHGPDHLLRELLSAWRLLNFDGDKFQHLASPAFLQDLFSHESPTVRYLAIRIFCQLLHASDFKLEQLIETRIGKDVSLLATGDGLKVDLAFLSLYEQIRVKRALEYRENRPLASFQHGDEGAQAQAQAQAQTLTPYVIAYGDAILPRPFGPLGDPPSLVMTSTTTQNLQALAFRLRSAEPILLQGLPGAGKTSLVYEVAKQLGMYSEMITLHLNEQTDAKMLIGLYSTDSTPGSFSWRPGVLTTAVREGRWVLVEDLDRAPTEILSTLLPLIERKELLIPSRGERIRAAESFRLIATIRSSKGLHGRETLHNILGMRFWQSLYVQPPAHSELHDIVVSKFPILRKFAPQILAVYERLSRTTSGSANTFRGRSILDRQLSLRDLLKWCRRMQVSLHDAGKSTGEEFISETTRDHMFMEATDCFAGAMPDQNMQLQMAYAVAEEMHLSRDRTDHYLTVNIPPLEQSDSYFRIGRIQLRKKKLHSRQQVLSRPFANTSHANRLLEQIASAVKLSEPVLLVGETGIGKTTVVQQLAQSLNHKLIAVNLSQQSEVGDLLGGFKPVNVRTLAVPLKEEFEDLFSATGISASKNQKYLDSVSRSFVKSQWSRLSKLWKEAPKMFHKIVSELERASVDRAAADNQPSKRRKTSSRLQALLDLRHRWDVFSRNLEQFEVQISAGAGTFAFSFMEGNLVKAIRNGDWVLLDEINLASPDTLESIASLLSGPAERPSILLSETGDIEKIVAHPEFRIFGAMNPATDIGKRDLPIGIRSRFTELYVHSPDKDLKDLLSIIRTYLGSTSAKDDQLADDIARLYMSAKRMAEEKRLVDGANEVPHFSLRTLTRVLSYVNNIAPLYGLRRAVFEGFSMGFLTLLDRESEMVLVPLIYHYLLDNYGEPRALLSQQPKYPKDGKQYIKFQNKARDRQYWLAKGAEAVVERGDYIITPYVERNLLNLVRATSTRKFPVLIQGPTSAGKTSMIEYLANFTGNKFVRINNHEHTDLQEYLGTYVSGPDGKLKFQEGLLVQAMRQGHWIVLDELNLAPTDVLEALNRLLDDNRELLIPETQEVVKPHENFILFATQNPPGLYGGRKVLSRAFRNRFLELHFDDIPESELEYILQQGSRDTSPPDCRRIVAVYKELSRLRQTNRLFEQKDSFATLRDLFRWALRTADTREEIAANGFMLLAERVRNADERDAVKTVIEKVFKVELDPHALYSASVAPELQRLQSEGNSQGVVWTFAMRRLYLLVSKAMKNREPVLLVGETGCGKTTVCQVLAEALKKEIRIVNAHQNTETGDLIGSQRPVRNRGSIVEALGADLRQALRTLDLDASGSIDVLMERFKRLDESDLTRFSPELLERIAENEIRAKALFEWSDGALVDAMREGHFFLLDEISLADDSVLERLNSVLEPSRTLLLAEKGIDNSFIAAADEFQFFATMNPGGDFGKKELSPALRNRFTEIWVPLLSENEDIYEIVKAKLCSEARHLVDPMIHFAVWFGKRFLAMAATPFSIREILVWVEFINTFYGNGPLQALVHGASTVFIDSIGANPATTMSLDSTSVDQQRRACVQKLSELLGRDVAPMYPTEPELTLTQQSFQVGGFSIARNVDAAGDPSFAMHAPTTRLNAMRVLRAMQMHRPILLEGSPGVGKTTLISALARTCGHPLTRINLSDQTDLMDLFGTDVPVEGAEAGNFTWRDAPFLQAMQKGEWVLLDEMNLASQSVLEGLNACLDHRGEVYISELDQTFKRHPDFCLFAAQNPHHQGGGRKGLPASFVNRFIVVFADLLTENDLQLIASHNYPTLSEVQTQQVIRFVSQTDHELSAVRSFGTHGAPWEFNLRDVLRWLDLMNSHDLLLRGRQPDSFLDILVRQRFRTHQDRSMVNQLFRGIFGHYPDSTQLYHDSNSTHAQVGLALLDRNTSRKPKSMPGIDVRARLREIESILICVEQAMPCIVSGASGTGKSALLEHVAALAGRELVIFPMNADVDAMDLVGGFEQADPLREVNAALHSMREALEDIILRAIPATVPAAIFELLNLMDLADHNVALPRLVLTMDNLLAQLEPRSDLALVITKALVTLKQPLTLANPRFEWLDGVIVDALETGKWLVLDNANLCNASVLDRLNSLLEPSGFLSLNEHCGPGGEPRIIRPHPDFRIFLTIDPRYGELSRAMRNRAVEIHLIDPPPQTPRALRKVADLESSLQRFSLVTDLLDMSQVKRQKALDIALDHLSLEDVSILQRFCNGLPFEDQDIKSLLDAVERCMHFSQSPSGSTMMARQVSLYASLLSGVATERPHGQSIHILNNSPLSTGLNGVAFWHAVCNDTLLTIADLSSTLDKVQRDARSTKISSLTRLQRSLVSDKVAAVAKDSTVSLYGFLSSMLESTGRFLMSPDVSPASWKRYSSSVRLIVEYMQRTIELTNDVVFEDAKFRSHVAQGIELLHDRKCEEDNAAYHTFTLTLADSLESHFAQDIKLSTGLGMDTLWPLLRPVPIQNQQVLRQSSQLEDIATRLDRLRWSSGATLPSIARTARALIEAYNQSRTSNLDVESLALDLTKEVQSLEHRVGTQPIELEPYFLDQFELLRQCSFLQAMSTVEDFKTASGQIPENLLTLSNNGIVSRARQSLSEGPASILQTIDNVSRGNEWVWDGHMMPALWSKMQAAGNVQLAALRLFGTEVPVLSQSFASRISRISEDPVLMANAVLQRLLDAVFAAFEGTDILSSLPPPDTNADWLASVNRYLPQVSSQIEGLQPDFFKSVAIAHFIPAAVALKIASTRELQRTSASAYAWIHASLGLLKLFVPDRPYDPQLRPLMQRTLFENVHSQLDAEIVALESFESVFTGEAQNARTSMLEAIRQELGPLPAACEPIFRPESSEINRLQAEFSNILNTATGTSLSTLLHTLQGGEIAADDAIQVLKDNVLRLYDRITTRFEPYQDLTQPIGSMLRCMLVGVSLYEASQAVILPEPLDQLMRVTPFAHEHASTASTADLPEGTEYLPIAAARVALQGKSSLSPHVRQHIFSIFHKMYEEWSQRLESDRKEAAANSSLFRFRGGLEDEEEADEEEFSVMFPVFDDEERAKPYTTSAKVRQIQSVSLLVAKLHKKIFLDPPSPSEAIQEALLSTVAGVVKEVSEYAHIDPRVGERLVPGILLRLEQAQDRLQSTETSASYNFYEDANLPEARKLAVLATIVKARFRDLQLVDEIGHLQPLEDVVQACDTLLQLAHTEPLAKIIPKVEKLHALVYEWQFGGWASRIYGVSNLHTDLTETVIRWRRLELSTWSSLFDMEHKRCEEDAASWWFIAYQVVIGVPLSMVDSRSKLESYCPQLINTLETYFASAIVGQYEGRLTLLRQLRNYLELLECDYPNLQVIRSALAHFITFYARYSRGVGESIRSGRAKLEKGMKDVVLMASWKDTNIAALRESARRSHMKLFRLVKKFRGVLGQEMRPIIEQGLPDEAFESHPEDQVLTSADGLELPPDVSSTVETTLPGWLDNHRRLAQLPTTLKVMQRVAGCQEVQNSLSQTLDTYMLDLNESISALRNETPSRLTEENKDLVKHLKSRKRKLFAEVLKTLRNMGFKHNLAQNKLVEQESLSTIIATTETLKCDDSRQLQPNYWFDKLLDLVPRARAAAQEHSEELTGAETSRGLGFVEGLLYASRVQRQRLAANFDRLSILRKTVESLQTLTQKSFEPGLLRCETHTDLTDKLSWASHGIDFAIRLIQIHAKLGEEDHTSAVVVLSDLQAKLKDHLTNLQQPASHAFTSRTLLDARYAASQDLILLRTVIENHPELRCVMRFLLPWTTVETTGAVQPNAMTSLADFATLASRLCDHIFAAMEQVKSTGAKVQRAEDHAGWATGQDEALQAMLDQSCLVDIAARVERCSLRLEQVNFDDQMTGSAARSVVVLICPILHNYVKFCEQRIVQSLGIHTSTTRMAYQLTTTFVQLAKQGFCSPQEQSNDKAGDAGQLESGTGLGDGEGAEDISKDIAPDEDLTELAQEANAEKDGEMEDEKDAVDMADEELEGDMGSVNGAEDDEEGSQGGQEDQEEQQMDEEAGDVDDLDPTAVDEKMWDGKDEEEAEKDQQGDKADGQQKKDDEQLAAENADKKKEDDTQPPTEEDAEQPTEEVGEEQENVGAQDEMNRQEETAQEQDTLAMPDDMDLNFDEQEPVSEDEDLNNLSDIEDEQKETADEDDAQESGDDEEEVGEQGVSEQHPAKEEDESGSEAADPHEEDNQMGPDEIDENVEVDEDKDRNKEDAATEGGQNDDDNTEAQDAAPSDVKGSGQHQSAESMELDEQFQGNAANQDEGSMGEGNADRSATAGDKGSAQRSQDILENGEQEKEADMTTQTDAFKKLGDALEKWHRQRSEIQSASDESEDQGKPQTGQEAPEQGQTEFQHLQNDDAAADTQAMGSANADEAQPLDESMAIDEEQQDPTSKLTEPTQTDTDDAMPDATEDDADASDKEPTTAQAQDQSEGRTGVVTKQGQYKEEEMSDEDLNGVQDNTNQSEEEIQETSTQLGATHLDGETSSLRDYGEALQQWTQFQTETNSLSLSLTSQLRLILTPSQSTKLSGAFRTGKRLNIKRIIPYIASSYKRDKIWMRRAIPTKRTYQILLCVDDSKSMGESSSGRLAMESLVMVARSLTMLEAGQVGVLGFGADVFSAHGLSEPFSADAGAKVLQHFTFSQDRTDIALLIRRTIDTFRQARLEQGGNSDLWQLSLILSDGLTPSSAHDSIRRLLREAIEERIMVVFIIMDDTGNKRKKGDSVLELKEAKFVKEGGESKVVIERYLDTFPFQYYLIVHDLNELPSALAGLLRTWFAEVTS